MIRTLTLTLEWLGNLEQAIGLDALLDAMPNNWRGRLELCEWLDLLREDSPWTFDAESGQIRDAGGFALATVPHAIAGDAADLQNGQLMALAPVLLQALRVALEVGP